MKKIEKDEIFQNLKEFLGVKGIQLTDGAYSQTIQKSCRIVADVINMGQQGIERAKTGIDTKLEQVRQAIHEKTAPKPPKTGTVNSEATGQAAGPMDKEPTNGKEMKTSPVEPKKKGKIRPKKTTATVKPKSIKKPKPPVT